MRSNQMCNATQKHRLPQAGAPPVVRLLQAMMPQVSAGIGCDLEREARLVARYFRHLLSSGS